MFSFNAQHFDSFMILFHHETLLALTIYTNVFIPNGHIQPLSIEQQQQQQQQNEEDMQ
jgi:hypothetical protein